MPGTQSTPGYAYSSDQRLRIIAGVGLATFVLSMATGDAGNHPHATIFPENPFANGPSIRLFLNFTVVTAATAWVAMMLVEVPRATARAGCVFVGACLVYWILRVYVQAAPAEVLSEIALRGLAPLLAVANALFAFGVLTTALSVNALIGRRDRALARVRWFTSRAAHQQYSVGVPVVVTAFIFALIAADTWEAMARLDSFTIRASAIAAVAAVWLSVNRELLNDEDRLGPAVFSIIWLYALVSAAMFVVSAVLVPAEQAMAWVEPAADVNARPVDLYRFAEAARVNVCRLFTAIVVVVLIDGRSIMPPRSNREHAPGTRHQEFADQ